jgi:group I intron endonuclease
MIKNIINNKVYIGQAIDLNRRKEQHIYELNGNRHNNKHLQRAWNKDGASNFIFSVIEKCSENNLTKREQYWINYYGGIDNNNNYNFREASSSGTFNKAVRAKMSKSTKKRFKKPVEKKKISGENNSANKLSKSDVLKIVELFVTKHYSMYKLGKMFNVGHEAIASIIDNQTFHIYNKEINEVLAKYNLTRVDLKNMKRKSNNKRKLSKEDVLNIIDLYLHDYSIYKIAKMYNMSETAISLLINGDTYKQYNDEIQQMIDNFYGDNVKQA